jgi:ABC-2 type transport system permease protein
VARRALRRHATYRGATLAGIFANTVFGFIKAYVLIALFAARPVLGGYRVADALTYGFVAQGLIATVGVWGWFEIEERIRSGQIAADLLRPYSFVGYWLAHDYGRAAYQVVARGVPPFLLAGVVFTLRLPRRPETAALFAASLLAAVAVGFAIRLMVNLFALWFLDSRGLAAVVMTPWTFLSGLAMPLAVFPGWLRTAARLTPFAATFDAPCQIFLEQATGVAALGLLALQAVWAAALLLAARALFAAGVRRLVIQGG